MKVIALVILTIALNTIPVYAEDYEYGVGVG